MRTIYLTATAVLIACTGAACGAQSMSETKPSNPYADLSKKKLSHPYADVSERMPPQPELKRNPNPTAYELTVTLKDAPGPFSSVKGFMQYETKLADPCLPDLGGMAGTRMRIKQNVPFELKKMGEATYRGIIYSDLFADHDYFGLGICHIGFVAARVEFRVNGNSEESAFIESVTYEDVELQREVRSGFLRRQYPDGTHEGAPVPSFPEGTPVRARVKDADLFGIELIARKLGR